MVWTNLWCLQGVPAWQNRYSSDALQDDTDQNPRATTSAELCKEECFPSKNRRTRNYLKLVHRPDCADNKTLNTLPSFYSTTICHGHQTQFYLISSAKESTATLWSLPDSDHQSFTSTHHGNLVTATAIILNSLLLGRRSLERPWFRRWKWWHTHNLCGKIQEENSQPASLTLVRCEHQSVTVVLYKLTPTTNKGITQVLGETSAVKPKRLLHLPCKVISLFHNQLKLGLHIWAFPNYELHWKRMSPPFLIQHITKWYSWIQS